MAQATTQGSAASACQIRSRAALASEASGSSAFTRVFQRAMRGKFTGARAGHSPEAGSSARALCSREIVAGDFFMRGGAWIDFGDQAAERQKVSAAGDAERERRLLLHEHNGKSLLVEKRQRAEDLID